MARTNELDENVNEASSYFIGFLLLERANMEKCISIALTTQDNAKMELLRGMASLAGTFYFFIYSAINRNKTPAKAFTPPAKRKWAQNQAGL